MSDLSWAVLPAEQDWEKGHEDRQWMRRAAATITDLSAALAQAQHLNDKLLATVERQAARSWEGVLARIAAIDARTEAEYDADDCEKPSPAQIAAARQFVAENHALTPPGDVYAMTDGCINMTWVLPLGARLEVDVEADGAVAGTLLWRKKDEKGLVERPTRASGHGFGVAFLYALLKDWPPPETPPDAAPVAT